LPEPTSTLAVSHADPAELWTRIGSWLKEHCPDGPPGYVASVHPETLEFVQNMFAGRLRVLADTDLPLVNRTDQPERVGIDRLLNAVAANRVRAADRPAIVVDLGTACTVDWIAADGAFEGGAILPGPTLAASALHTGTASLPQLPLDFSEAPPVVGKSTSAAIASGIYWGMVGAVRELTERIRNETDTTPHLFLTGGEAPRLVAHLADDRTSARHIPNLVLSGIAVAVGELP